MEYIVKYGQNFLDIALQELGSIEGVLILARDNNLSITADLEIGQIIKVDITKIIDKKVVEYYQNNKIIVATEVIRIFIECCVPVGNCGSIVFLKIIDTSQSIEITCGESFCFKLANAVFDFCQHLYRWCIW